MEHTVVLLCVVFHEHLFNVAKDSGDITLIFFTNIDGGDSYPSYKEE